MRPELLLSTKLQLVSVFWEGDRNREKKLPRQCLHLLAFRLPFARQVHKGNLLDIFAAQELEQLPRRHMCQFADQQVKGLGHQRRQIFRAPNISRMPDATPLGFDQKTKRLEILRVLALKSLLKIPEMAGGK